MCIHVWQYIKGRIDKVYVVTCKICDYFIPVCKCVYECIFVDICVYM